MSGVALGMTVGKPALQLFQNNPCDPSHVTFHGGTRQWANVLLGHAPDHGRVWGHWEGPRPEGPALLST